MAQTGRLRNAIENFLSEFTFGDVVSEILRVTRERDETEWLQIVSALLDTIIDATKSAPQLQALLKDVRSGKHQLGATLLSGIASTATSGASSAALGPVFRIINAELEKKLHSNLPDVSMLLDFYNRKFIKREAVEETLNMLGYHPSMWPIFIDASKPRLGVSELINLSRRYPEARQSYIDRIKELGWEDKELNPLLGVTLQYPSVGDWIRFAVREATNEQRVNELGLDQGDYGIAAQEAEKSGLAPGYFKYYWRSHWELPTISHAFEFLHRLRPGRADVSFTLKDFSSLLVALDISPKWHDYYRAVSYAPIGRVDLRRIYKTTNKDRSWLVEQYQDVDYSKEDAETLADWTIIDAEQSLRDASLSTIEKSVERGILTEGEAQVALEALKYGADDIKIYLANWRYAREDKRISAEIDYLKVRYLAAELTEEQLRSELNNLGLSPNNIAIAMANLNAQRKRQVVALSVGQIEDMYEENILDYNQMVVELEARGTTKINAKRLAQLIDVKRQRKTDKELEAAMKEQERITASEAKTDKQIATARIQVQIATRNAETADLKKVYPEITDLATLSAIDARLAEIKQEVAYLQLEKTKVNLQYAERIEVNA